MKKRLKKALAVALTFCTLQQPGLSVIPAVVSRNPSCSLTGPGLQPAGATATEFCSQALAAAPWAPLHSILLKTVPLAVLLAYLRHAHPAKPEAMMTAIGLPFLSGPIRSLRRIIERWMHPSSRLSERHQTPEELLRPLHELGLLGDSMFIQEMDRLSSPELVKSFEIIAKDPEDVYQAARLLAGTYRTQKYLRQAFEEFPAMTASALTLAGPRIRQLARYLNADGSMDLHRFLKDHPRELILHVNSVSALHDAQGFLRLFKLDPSLITIASSGEIKTALATEQFPRSPLTNDFSTGPRKLVIEFSHNDFEVYSDGRLLAVSEQALLYSSLPPYASFAERDTLQQELGIPEGSEIVTVYAPARIDLEFIVSSLAGLNTSRKPSLLFIPASLSNIASDRQELARCGFPLLKRFAGNLQARPQWQMALVNSTEKVLAALAISDLVVLGRYGHPLLAASQGAPLIDLSQISGTHDRQALQLLAKLGGSLRLENDPRKFQPEFERLLENAHQRREHKMGAQQIQKAVTQKQPGAQLLTALAVASAILIQDENDSVSATASTKPGPGATEPDRLDSRGDNSTINRLLVWLHMNSFFILSLIPLLVAGGISLAEHLARRPPSLAAIALTVYAAGIVIVGTLKMSYVGFTKRSSLTDAGLTAFFNQSRDERVHTLERAGVDALVIQNLCSSLQNMQRVPGLSEFAALLEESIPDQTLRDNVRETIRMLAFETFAARSPGGTTSATPTTVAEMPSIVNRTIVFRNPADANDRYNNAKARVVRHVAGQKYEVEILVIGSPKRLWAYDADSVLPEPQLHTPLDKSSDSARTIQLITDFRQWESGFRDAWVATRQEKTITDAVRRLRQYDTVDLPGLMAERMLLVFLASHVPPRLASNAAYTTMRQWKAIGDTPFKREPDATLTAWKMEFGIAPAEIRKGFEKDGLKSELLAQWDEIATFGEAVRSLRRIEGLSRDELHSASAIPRNTILGWERDLVKDVRNPEHYITLAKVLHVETARLIEKGLREKRPLKDISSLLERIHRLRIEIGKTEDELLTAIPNWRRYIADYERGLSVPVGFTQELCAFLRVSDPFVIFIAQLPQETSHRKNLGPRVIPGTRPLAAFELLIRRFTLDELLIGITISECAARIPTRTIASIRSDMHILVKNNLFWTTRKNRRHENLYTLTENELAKSAAQLSDPADSYNKPSDSTPKLQNRSEQAVSPKIGPPDRDKLPGPGGGKLAPLDSEGTGGPMAAGNGPADPDVMSEAARAVSPSPFPIEFERAIHRVAELRTILGLTQELTDFAMPPPRKRHVIVRVPYTPAGLLEEIVIAIQAIEKSLPGNPAEQGLSAIRCAEFLFKASLPWVAQAYGLSLAEFSEWMQKRGANMRWIVSYRRGMKTSNMLKIAEGARTWDTAGASTAAHLSRVEQRIRLLILKIADITRQNLWARGLSEWSYLKALGVRKPSPRKDDAIEPL